MPDDLVTIMSFWTTTEAYLARHRLEGEGIKVYLADEATTGLWAHANAIGGIKLLVQAADADRASDLLDPDISGETATDQSQPESATEFDPDEVHPHLTGDSPGFGAETDREEDDDDADTAGPLTAFRNIRRPIIWFFLWPVLAGLFFAGVVILKIIIQAVLSIFGMSLD